MCIKYHNRVVLHTSVCLLCPLTCNIIPILPSCPVCSLELLLRLSVVRATSLLIVQSQMDVGKTRRPPPNLNIPYLSLSCHNFVKYFCVSPTPTYCISEMLEYLSFACMCVFGVCAMRLHARFSMYTCVCVFSHRSLTPSSRGVCRCCPGIRPLSAPRPRSRPGPRPPLASPRLPVPLPK